MKARYLLPCSCGQETPVEASQAGQLVTCACGAQQEVPTLLRLSALKRAPESEATAPKPQRRWGLRQRLVLVGAGIALFFLALAALKYSWRPREEYVLTHSRLESLNYMGVWAIWQDLREGIARHATAEESNFGQWTKIHRLWMGFLVGMAVVGGLVMLSAWFVPAAKPGGLARR